MTRKPAFWIVLALLGVAGSAVALRLFPLAFPILSLDIQMDRDAALARSRELAERNGWEPVGFRQAASFTNLDPTFQTYMELEGGGLGLLHRLVEEGAFSLYAWRVRHFSPGAVEEAEIRFTPRGETYGFKLRLSEDAPGENLSAEEAEALAAAEVDTEWGLDLGPYRLLEASQEEHPGGRVDHSFVFERSDLVLGEARIRLRLGVGGNRLTEITPFLHVPEAFVRRFQDTRNTNDSISLAGTVVFLLLFLVLGGGFGAVHLLKARRIEWKAPLLWGSLIAGLLALGSVNGLPLAWMSYDTAVPPQVFVASTVVMAAVTFIAGAGFLALLFAVAEGLLRAGLPDEIQLWKMWSPKVANSTPALGRTVAPYLVLGLELGFVVTFYLLMTRWAGWWSPAGALVEPDLLATRFPWLTAVGTSLFAAFSEESTFRAIPIGVAAILGRRHGRPGLWIWGAVVLQAVVFGASHANYPQQPAYARVVEIFPTYLAWGAITVFFGLVPAIIGHFTYDLVFFSLPLFAADTSGIWLDRGVVIAAGVFPLAVVLLSRWRHGAANQVPEWALNRGWAPPSRTAQAPESTEGAGLSPSADPVLEGVTAGRAEPLLEGGPSPGARILLAVAGIVGLTLWAWGIDPQPMPRLGLTMPEAEARARATLQDQGLNLGSDWVPLASVAADRGITHQFVWTEGSESDYRTLVGDFLDEPGWRVRYVTFQAAPEERAESFSVRFNSVGDRASVVHGLPEGRPGASLTEGEARSVAFEALERRLGLAAGDVREISAQTTARPARADWTFTFAVDKGYPLQSGEGRAEVGIAGNEVVEAVKYVHVPEQWERDWRGEQSRRGLARIPFATLLGLLAMAGMILAVVKWARGALETTPLRILTAVTGGGMLLATANAWPAAEASFTTELSYGNQVVMTLLGTGLAAVAVAAAVGLLGALAHTWLRGRPPITKGTTWIGFSLGVGYVGLSNLLSWTVPPGLPGWPDYSGAASYLPWASVGIGQLTSFLTLSAAALLTVATLERLLGTRWLWVGVPLAILIGLNLSSNPTGLSWWIWILRSSILAAGIGMLWVLCKRWGWSIVPGLIAGPVLLGGLETAMARPHAGAAAGSLLGMAAVAAAAHVWTRSLGHR